MIEIEGLQVEPVIGLEIHVHLRTRTKMWCGCELAYGADPNTRVCPVCLGLPGALPVANRSAVEQSIRMGIALNCRIAEFSKWDRKSYYYPDLPKNYQISQYDLPLCADGFLEFPYGDAIRKIRITRAHLEEDAGKNIHDIPGCTAVDLNRAGSPLLEIVTEPDLAGAGETREFAMQLHRLVRYLGISEANMQLGQMRFEPNINVRIHKDSQVYSTPIVEVKNLNSFRSVQGAIDFEIQRQTRAWLEDGQVARPGNKANRGWDDVREVTVPQREKEEANDYRYFPDPDLVPVCPDPDTVAAWQAATPELPLPRTDRFVSEYKLPPREAPVLVDCKATADLLDEAGEFPCPKETLGKHFLSFWSRLANERETTIAGLGVPSRSFSELAALVGDQTISATAAAQIAEEMVKRIDAELGDVSRPSGAACQLALEPIVREDWAPARLAEELGLVQSQDTDEIAAWVAAAFADNEKAVQDALANPKKRKAARGFLTGAVLKQSGGKADPKLVGQLIEAELARRAEASD